MRRIPNVNAGLKRRDGESDRAHRAMLLWAMQAPDARNMRATARAVKSSDNAIRKWKVVWAWERRTEDPTSDVQAGTMYAALYHAMTGGAEVTLVAEWMAYEYAPPGTKGSEVEDVHPTPFAKAVDAHLENDRILAETDDSKRRRRLEALLDVAETRLLNDLVSDQQRGPSLTGIPAGIDAETWQKLPAAVRAQLLTPAAKVPVRVADVQHLVRGRAYLAATRAPTTDGKQNRGADLARSRLVERMIEQGHEPAVALKAEYEELGLIIDTLRDHAEASNVVRFPARSSPGESTGS